MLAKNVDEIDNSTSKENVLESIETKQKKRVSKVKK